MRLFSKVKPGTAFVADTESHSAADPEHDEARVARAAQDDDRYEQQVCVQAAAVAVDSTAITHFAYQYKCKHQHAVAPVWTDGNLGSKEGLPDRKTRIYIPADMAQPGGIVSTVKVSKWKISDTDGPHAKKKRKGKAERNRLKREREQAATSI